MSRAWKLALLLTVALSSIVSTALSQALKEPRYTAKDREVIEAYYSHIIGTLAPGSLDRSPFAPEVERTLVVGGHFPMGLADKLERLPEKLESQLSPAARRYGSFKLGRHIILMKTSDGFIADIIKNVALKETRR